MLIHVPEEGMIFFFESIILLTKFSIKYFPIRVEAKYPQLCELCTSTTSHCEYADKNRHFGALRCLINKGGVAYVSLQDVQDFFSPVNGNLYNHAI